MKLRSLRPNGALYVRDDVHALSLAGIKPIAAVHVQEVRFNVRLLCQKLACEIATRSAKVSINSAYEFFSRRMFLL
jgi:hypothetical protein